MNWETYVAYGDSITIGARTYLGYPELVANKLAHHQSKQWNVINHAVSGLKAVDLARHIDLHSARLKEHHASVATILIGTNDVKENTSSVDFRIALDQVIFKVKLLTVNRNVIILEIPDFHVGIMYPYSIEMNALIAEYNEIIRQLAAGHNVRCLTIRHEESDFTDGVHLNRKGIEQFSEQISRYILKDKGIVLG